MVGGPVDPEAGLVPEVQIPDHLHGVLVLQGPISQPPVLPASSWIVEPHEGQTMAFGRSSTTSIGLWQCGHWRCMIGPPPMKRERERHSRAAANPRQQKRTCGAPMLQCSNATRAMRDERSGNPAGRAERPAHDRIEVAQFGSTAKAKVSLKKHGAAAVPFVTADWASAGRPRGGDAGPAGVGRRRPQLYPLCLNLVFGVA
jgi:hypothetical protein